MIKSQQIFEMGSKRSLKSLFHIRNSCILSSFTFLIFSFLVSLGHAHICPSDYIMDVTPGYSDQFNGQSFIIDFHNNTLKGPEGSQMGITGDRLQLLFSLRRFGHPETVTQSIGSSGFENLDFGTAEHPEDTAIEDLVREAVRDGYRRLNESLQSLRERGLEELPLKPFASIIIQAKGDRMIIPVGSLDYIRTNDVFNVYPKDGYNYDECDTVRYSSPSLATARVVEQDRENSLLEIVAGNLNLGRSIQVADVVELSQTIDLESRMQMSNNNQLTKRTPLRLGDVSDIFISFKSTSDEYIGRDITHYIEQFLAEKAPESDFRLIQ